MRTLPGDQSLREPFTHGDLTVTGHLNVAATLTVTGSLTVAGMLFDDHSGCRISVGRDLSATGVFAAGDLIVGGDVTADIVYCTALPAETLASGTVRARLVMEDDYQVMRHRIETDVYLDLAAYDPELDTDTARRLRALLVDEVFDDGTFDHRDLFDRMLAGEPVFRPSVLAQP